jgi:hypothetical protein
LTVQLAELEAGAALLLELLLSEEPLPVPDLSEEDSFFEDESPSLLEPPLELSLLELSLLELSLLELSLLELSLPEPSPFELSAPFLPEPLPEEAARESVL